MSRTRTIWWELLLAGMCIAGVAQSAFSQGDAGSPPTSKTPGRFAKRVVQPGHASGASLWRQCSDPEPGESAVVRPRRTEPGVAGAQSQLHISTAIQVGESGDSNANNALGGSSVDAVSHVLGALDLQKFWPRSDLFLEYLGGVVEGDERSFQRQLHALGLEGVTRWRTGQITVRDGFSYLPDGSFSASSAGGLPGFGIATGRLGLGLPGVFHLEEGSVGTIPRLSNLASLDVVQAITPRSAFTVIGAYANDHFYHNAGNELINGDEHDGRGRLEPSGVAARSDGDRLCLSAFPFPAGRWRRDLQQHHQRALQPRDQRKNELYWRNWAAVHRPAVWSFEERWSPTGRAVLRYRIAALVPDGEL